MVGWTGTTVNLYVCKYVLPLLHYVIYVTSVKFRSGFNNYDYNVAYKCAVAEPRTPLFALNDLTGTLQAFILSLYNLRCSV